MTEKQRLEAREAHSHYFCEGGETYQLLNDRKYEEHEMRRRSENMNELRKFQADHNIRITPEQENQFRKWISEGFSFSLDFNIHSDSAVPIDEDYGFCYIDYLLTDSDEFRMEVDEYRIRCMLNSLYDDADRCRKLIKDLQFIEMQKHLMECSKTYGIKEIKGCIAWINDGHGFWNNPFGVHSINGSEANYLEALHCLIKK